MRETVATEQDIIEPADDLLRRAVAVTRQHV